MARSSSAPASRARKLAVRLFALVALPMLVACQAEMPRLEDNRSPRGSLGEEIYKVVCRRLAATQLPRDLAGRESETLCLGDAQSAQQELSARAATFPPALRALAERRARFVRAVDQTLPADQGSELELLMRGLVPYYRPPEELIARSTRATALLLEQLVGAPLASQGAARLTRDGMTPEGTRNGVLRALLAHEDLAKPLRALLPALIDGDAAGPFRALREAAALELATTTPADPDEVALTRRLFTRADYAATDRFGSGTALFSVRRDARGMPLVSKPGGQLAYPFVDRDGDGLADISGDRFVLDGAFQGALPEPYPVVGEPPTVRDARGRACALTRVAGADCAQLLYEHASDRDATFMAGLLSELGRLFAGSPSIVESALVALPTILEPTSKHMRAYGVRTHSFDGLPQDDSVLLDVVHASVALFADARLDDGVALLMRLLAQHEATLAHSLSPLLEMERRTREADDAYPEAVLTKGHVFWDELAHELELLSRMRASKGGESALGGLLRAALGYARATERAGQPFERLLSLKQISHLGALTALMMRFKDDWRPSPRPATSRAKDEPATIGAFAVPVDRTLPATPVRCGKHGCGGRIEGSGFERFKLEGQRCLIEQPGRRGLGDDCGAASNQSIFHRGLGLLAEAANRSQCNRAVSIRDLVGGVFSGDPCANLDDAPSCQIDTDCRSLSIFRDQDFACDIARKLCVAKPNSVSCTELKRRQEETLDSAAFLADRAIALDYTCPDNASAPCRAYAQKYPGAFIDADGRGPQGAALQPCHAIDLPDVGRTFGRTVTHEYTLDMPNPWVRRFIEDVARAGPISASDDRPKVADCELAYRITDPKQTPPCIPFAARTTRAALDDIPADVDTLGELFELLLGDPALFGNDADTRDLRPDPKVLARVLFSPSNDDDVQLFNPILLRGAPATCDEAPALKPCVVESADSLPINCCIDAENPPLRYRLDTYYGATTFAWEQDVKMSDGTSLSFLDAVRPVADVFNKIEASATEPLEDSSYGLTRLGKLLAQHYDTADSLTQNIKADALWYSKQTGIVSYERLLADLLDDGKVDLAQAGPSGPLFGQREPQQTLDLITPVLALFETLDGLSFDAARDGLAVWHTALELYTNPHAWCAGEAGDDRVLQGAGACDKPAPERPRAPLAFRSGRQNPCWSDGRCFDGAATETPKRFASPLALMLEPLRVIARRADGLPVSRDAFHALLDGVLDRLLRVNEAGFVAPRIPALAHAVLQYTRDRWSEEKAQGALDSYGARTLQDAADSITGPLGSALFTTAEALGKSGDAARALAELGWAALQPEHHRALLASLSDALELPDGEPSLLAFTQQLGAAFAPNVQRALSTPSEALRADEGVVIEQLRVLAKLSALDDQAVLSRVLHNLSNGAPNGPAPLELLSELLFAINRVDPTTNVALDGPDMAAVLRTLSDVMRDEKRGFERLYRIVQCATAPAGARCD